MSEEGGKKVALSEELQRSLGISSAYNAAQSSHVVIHGKQKSKRKKKQQQQQRGGRRGKRAAAPHTPVESKAQKRSRKLKARREVARARAVHLRTIQAAALDTAESAQLASSATLKRVSKRGAAKRRKREERDAQQHAEEEEEEEETSDEEDAALDRRLDGEGPDVQAEAAKLEEARRQQRELSEQRRQREERERDAAQEEDRTLLADMPYRNVHVQRVAAIEEQRKALPIVQEEARIMEAIRYNNVVIVCGETGSGKTSQLPQWLYEYGYTAFGSVVVTQPRRVAVLSIHRRLKEELNVREDSTVGYHVRYDRAYGKAGSALPSIVLMTDGVLLKMLESHFLLMSVHVIVIDEAHERTLFSDVLIGLLSRIVALRMDMFRNNECYEGRPVHPLKLVIMSATLRVQDFVENPRLFPRLQRDGKSLIPVIRVAGRQYKVSVHWSKITPPITSYLEAVFKRCCSVHSKLPYGSMLVFLPGKREIRSLVARLREAFRCYASDLENGTLLTSWEEKRGVRVLPLYSGLPKAQQMEVFDLEKAALKGYRNVVVTTNIAETSLTIPNVKYVVDSGLRRYKLNAVTSTEQVGSSSNARFDVGYVSKSSADQRAGRAGRVMDGHCYRVYSSAFYNHHMEQFDEPQILTTPVENIVLTMKAMGIHNVEGFPFPTPPKASAIRVATQHLVHVGLLLEVSTAKKQKQRRTAQQLTGRAKLPTTLSTLGRQCSEYPVAPHFARMLVTSARPALMCLIVAVLSVQDVWGEAKRRKMDERERKAEEAQRKRWGTADNSIMEIVWHCSRLVELAGAHIAQRSARGAKWGSVKEAETYCFEYGLKWKAMREILQLAAQLIGIHRKRSGGEQADATAEDLCSVLSAPPSAEDLLNVRQCVLGGLPYNLALRMEGHQKQPHFKQLWSGTESVLLQSVQRLAEFRSANHRWIVFVESLSHEGTVTGRSASYLVFALAINPTWLYYLFPPVASAKKSKVAPVVRYFEEVETSGVEWDASNDATLCTVRPLYGPLLQSLPKQKVKLDCSLYDRAPAIFAKLVLEGEAVGELRAFKQYLQVDLQSLMRPLEEVRSPAIRSLIKAFQQARADCRAALQRALRQNQSRALLQAVSDCYPKAIRELVKSTLSDAIDNAEPRKQKKQKKKKAGATSKTKAEKSAG